MSDMRKAFLVDIIENIDDDTPRLVFADWLEDNGDPARAEFIRLQCRLAAEVGWVPPWNGYKNSGPFDDREAALIAEHGGEWKKEAPKWATKRFGFYRGFVSLVDGSAREWLEGVRALYRRTPVEGLDLQTHTNGEGRFLAVAARPECKYLRLLRFTTYGTATDALRQFFASADLRRLVTLEYGLHRNVIESLGAMLASERLTQVRCLVLNRGEYGKEGAALLATSALLARLKSLRIWGAEKTETLAIELARSPNVGGLEELSLRASSLGDRGVVALASSPYLSKLRHLEIEHDILSDQSIRALTASPFFENLIHLRSLRLTTHDCSGILARLAERRRERGIE